MSETVTIPVDDPGILLTLVTRGRTIYRDFDDVTLFDAAAFEVVEISPAMTVVPEFVR